MVNPSYWDTSCILPLYVAEPLSAKVAVLGSEENGPLTSSTILEYEMIFALHAKEAKGELASGSATQILDQFRGDIRKGRFVLAPLGRDVADLALKIADTALHSTPPLFLRTLEGIHIATARQLHASRILTADGRMAAAAAMFGLEVVLLPEVGRREK